MCNGKWDCLFTVSRKFLCSLCVAAVEVPLDLPKSSLKKGRDDLSRTAHSWITQLDGWTVFGMADQLFDQYQTRYCYGGKPTLKHKCLYVKTNRCLYIGATISKTERGERTCVDQGAPLTPWFSNSLRLGLNEELFATSRLSVSNKTTWASPRNCIFNHFGFYTVAKVRL